MGIVSDRLILVRFEVDLESFSGIRKGYTNGTLVHLRIEITI